MKCKNCASWSPRGTCIDCEKGADRRWHLSASFECRCGYHTNVPTLSRRHDCPDMKADVYTTNQLLSEIIAEEG